MHASGAPRSSRHRFVWFCNSLERIGSRFGIRGQSELAQASRKSKKLRGKKFPTPRAESGRGALEELKSCLSLSGMQLSPETVLAASKTLLVLAGLAMVAASLMASMVIEPDYLAPCVILSFVIPYLASQALRSYPSSAASRRAAMLLKDSTEATNLMIMSIRHEPSLSNAIRFACRKKGEFTDELKVCVWGVIMGSYSSFEEAVLSLGNRWARHSEELKASLNSMITATRESTEDGKRRALDRANNALISGARRRIEQYALSLSTPSMIMFGLGIILPLMVGSFLPMLSWDLWSMADLGKTAAEGHAGNATIQTVFVMNILFPSVALLVALNASASYPLSDSSQASGSGGMRRIGMIACAVSSVVVGALAFLLGGQVQPVAFLTAITFPVSIWLMIEGRRSGHGREQEDHGLEDVLFKTGARMLEGENFEAALNRTAADLDGKVAASVKRISYGLAIAGQELDSAADIDSLARSGVNALEGIRIVRSAATKDEAAAGKLAMDLAAYLRDLRDLESSLRNRLRPTISMMKITTHVLAPIVLGVTFVIYLSLASMMGGDSYTVQSGTLLLVLGMFLAEVNAVVVYFVWGVEGRRGMGTLMASIGSCIMTSETIYMAVAICLS